MSYRKIAQIGASGSVGAPIHKALVKSGKFEITVIVRNASTFTSSDPSVKVVKVDLENHQELVDALKGNEAVILSLKSHPERSIDAAIEAGVKRIIPSEFGGDTNSPNGRTQFIFENKVKLDNYLEEKSKDSGIEFTSIYCGFFFDWKTPLVQMFLGFDIAGKKVTLYNGGNKPINTTTHDTIGESVISVLSTPDKFKNKRLRISDFYVSQKELLAIVEEETGIKFEVQEKDADKLEEESEAALRKGDWSFQNIGGAVLASGYATKGSSNWGQPDDTASLGIPQKDIRTEIRNGLSL